MDKKWFLNPNIVVVRKIDRYEEKNGQTKPIFGERLGIYHPFLAKIFLLDKLEWKVFDSLLARDENSNKTLDFLHKNNIVLKNGEETDFQITPSFDSSEMYIKTTEGCNFSCPGCATSSDLIPASQAKLLTVDLARLFLESYIKSCSQKKIKSADIKWAGGEPMLQGAFRVVESCQQIIKKLQNKYPEVKISQTILTNGVFLTEDKIDFCAKNDIHVSVSLWGTEKFQDKMRHPRNKMETFPIIINNLKKLMQKGGSFNVSYVLTPQNALDFPNFLKIMWDTQNLDYVGNSWSKKEPLPLGIGFFRPQTKMQVEVMKKGYKLMENGLRQGFAVILDLIKKGVKVPPLHKIDYLDLLNVITTPCGSGFTYVAVGPEGATSCHEGLYKMKNNLERIKKGENLFDIVNQDYKKDRKLLFGPNIKFNKGQILALHGGQGCPRLAKEENSGKFGKASSTSILYEAIFHELLSLETMRQLKVLHPN